MQFRLSLSDPILLAAVLAYLFLPWKNQEKVGFATVFAYLVASLVIVCVIQYTIRRNTQLFVIEQSR